MEFNMDFNNEQQLYITNLLSETLPEGHQRNSRLESLNINPQGPYIILQLMLSNAMKKYINGLDNDAINSWKNQFHTRMKEAFTGVDSNLVCILNLQPFTRTLVLSIPDTGVLPTLFNRLADSMNTHYQTSILGCFGSVCSSFFDIGDSYKKARRLQEYHYVIGMGSYAFFDTFTMADDYSLVEYKYIHHFESLFRSKQWIQLYDLLDTVHDALIEHRVNDSKSSYIYKEIFSITIRQLFDQSNAFADNIQSLNEAITMFDHQFDDLMDVHHFYLDILRQITEESNPDFIHLHIKKALRYIHDHYMDTISLNSMSDTLGISTAYFSRLFREQTGVNFKEYLTQYRMKNAKRALQTTQKDIKHIAHDVGYPSATQFSRAFKNVEGMTPTEFRLTTNRSDRSDDSETPTTL